uniref:Conoporin 8 n=1 Tax=Conus geographus TaxID=6491 RepID=W4VS64_CONGE
MGVPFPALKTMVTVYLLLMGNMSPVVTSSTRLSRVKAIASRVVTPGSSLHGVSLKDLAETKYGVTCAIQVENWTKFSLKDPKIQNNGGVTTTTAIGIEPGKREAFAVRKTADSATGVSGIVSWELDGARRRFVIMWSVPYDFNLHSSWMAMGMTRDGLVAPNKNWYDQMYNRGNDGDLTFARKKVYHDTNSFIYSNDKFEAEGDMTNTFHAQVKVVIRPSSNKFKNLAPEILQELKEKRPAA